MALTRLSPTATPGRAYSTFQPKAAAVAPRGSDLFTQLSVTATPGGRRSISAKGGHQGQFTWLSVTATPGPKRSFQAKDAAAFTPHEGDFTQLSVTATPGPRRSFLAKDAAAPPSGHEGEFTWLSVIALPGGRRTILAKTEAPIVPPTEPEIVLPGGGMAGEGDLHWEYRQRKRDRILREDEEIIEIVSIIVASGILEE